MKSLFRRLYSRSECRLQEKQMTKRADIRMMIEIRGVSFVNKGAELMLYAIQQRVSEERPDARFVMEPRGAIAPYWERAIAGLYQKLPSSSDDRDTAKLCKISEKSRKAYGLVLDSEIDVVLDASGLAYGDQMGEKKSIMMAKMSRKWRRQGTKIVLLPQAFGPFSTPKIRDAAKEIADNAHLIFARENVSYKYLTEVAGKRQNIKIAPDFTNLLHGKVLDHHKILNNRFCIVPNTKMINACPPADSVKYVPFLISCVKYLHSKGQKPFFLAHCKDDTDIIELISKSLDSKIELVFESDPLIIKGILGNCSGVISSRFHGLVNSLSQGVPSLATSWSHKYKELFKEYGFEEGLINAIDDKSEIEDKIDLIADAGSNLKIREKLKITSEHLKKDSESMWNQVMDLILN